MISHRPYIYIRIGDRLSFAALTAYIHAHKKRQENLYEVRPAIYYSPAEI